MRRFNVLAVSRGYAPLEPPSEDVGGAFQAAGVPIATDGPLGTRAMSGASSHAPS